MDLCPHEAGGDHWWSNLSSRRSDDHWLVSAGLLGKQLYCSASG